MSNWKVPLSDLDYGVEEEKAIQRVLQRQWLSMGPEVKVFEEEFSSFLGVKHAIAVSSGTAALQLAYLALGLGKEDEVIQPALNFVAAANTAIAVGVRPIFADIISLDEPTLDITDVEHRITQQTKAIVVMHYGGYPCRMADLRALCERHDLAVIEDACHAVGARYLDSQARFPHGHRVGQLGDIACFSFFSNKNLATGEGGLITTDQDDLAKRVRLLRSHGMTTLTWERHKGHARSYDVVLHGFNYRFDEIRAALGRTQLQKLESNNHRRQEIVNAYYSQLDSLSNWIIPFRHFSGDSAYHLMPIVAPDQRTRERVVQDLKLAGIQTSLHYPCITNFTAFAHLEASGVEKSKAFSQRVITLPLYPTMTLDQVNYVCSNLLSSSRISLLEDSNDA
ncbi:MAG: DegT/DnrJ/EryC1/StrS family aminotransferase [Moorea sp. SIO1F2]|uniref:DegT/DnrJ/EryC1/StrS family aminotransferase n=1 Tax=Moorena sp. SIO1F2 TaxID=2607819 RepID=UPI0013BB6419|nr:DegT/DnrJ/EryC1/StrS family aminotransferase [Moorena sp. SIO1F2]NEO44064.1 DegT/DnrJ/EryC1/StrS family aminotransferase [Moorena sp. SIO4A3]NET83819.1 DegT/DnrJ/EryC1/StrS family aminotransferase [Moorena sp. SIO1F2]